MSISMYTASVPVFRQVLGSLAAILEKAESHADLKKIEPDALLQARLYPDMFPLQRQVLVAAEFAQSVSARLAGMEAPVPPEPAPGFAGLQERILQATEFVRGLAAVQFESSDTRSIVLRPGTPKEKHLTGQTYLFNYGLPQFFFHVTTAYAILRHNGVEIGKKDYMNL